MNSPYFENQLEFMNMAFLNLYPKSTGKIKRNYLIYFFSPHGIFESYTQSKTIATK